LTIDKFGILSATREAIAKEEQLLCTPSPNTLGMFSIKTQRDSFLTVDQAKSSIELRGDAKAIDHNSTFHIRMQARFKPRLNANKVIKAREKISRKELEQAAGRKLEDEEVKKLKRARRTGNYHEAILEVRVRGKHDKFAS
jgi:protein FRG1